MMIMMYQVSPGIMLTTLVLLLTPDSVPMLNVMVPLVDVCTSEVGVMSHGVFDA